MGKNHKYGAELRKLAEQMAREYNAKIPIGELVSQKYVTNSVGLKLTDFVAIKKPWKTPDYGGKPTYEKVYKQYNFKCIVLWLHHPDLDGEAISKYDTVYFDLIKKVDEKKVLERLK